MRFRVRLRGFTIGLLAAACLLAGWLVPARAQSPDGSGSPSASASPSATPTLMVDANGNGRLSLADNAPQSNGKGKLNAALDVKSGLGIVQMALDLPKDAKGTGAGYLEADSKKLFGVGQFNVTETQDLKGNMHFKWAQGPGGTAAGSGTLSLDFPPPQENIPVNNMGLDGNGDFTYKTAQLGLHFSMSGGASNNIPLDVLNLSLTEAGNVSTIAGTIGVASSSPMAAQLRPVLSSPQSVEQMVKQMLTSKGLDVDSVSITNVKSSGDQLGFDITIKVKALHDTLKTMVSEMTRSLGPQQADLNKGVGEMLAVQVDKLEIKASRKAENLDVTLNLNASNTDKFMEGYFDTSSAIMAATAQRRNHLNPTQQLQMNASDLEMKKLRQVWEAAAASSDKGTFKFSLKAQAADKRIKVDGTMDGSADTKGFHAAAQANNYPTMDSQYLLADAKADGKNANGQLFLQAEGNWFDSIKAIYADAAKATPGFADLSQVLAQLNFSGSQISLQLGSGTVNGNGYMQLSDLSGALKMALQKNAPNFKGNVVAFSADVDSTTPPGTSVANIYFTDLPKTEAELKDDFKALNVGSVQLKTGADARTVSAPAVSKPNVAMPPELNAVAEADRKELGISGIAGAPGAPGAPSGSSSMLIIAVGAIIIVLGLALAMRKK
ncbi:MAG: hypothetical protein ACYCW6_26940 [Candidatus Xenobia bacterium]